MNGLVNLEGEKRKSIPVSFSSALTDCQLPYTVRVDQHRAYEVLRRYGMHGAQLDNLQLIFDRSNPDAHGEYIDGKITLFTEGHWQGLNNPDVDNINISFLHEVAHAIEFQSNEALERADRWKRTKDRLIYPQFIVPIVSLSYSAFVFLHYNRPLLDDNTCLISLFASVAALALPYFAYLYSPHELRARNFSHEIDEMPEWRDIVVIEPKDSSEKHINSSFHSGL